MTQPGVSVVTLGVFDQSRARRFYEEGFGWAPVFRNEEIVFYQLAGLVLGLFDHAALEEDMRRPGLVRPGAFALARNVRTRQEVEPLLTALAGAGGTLLRPADAPPHGGFRGYVADPDDHAWEIAWNPAWPMDEEGRVAFAL